MKLFRHLSPLPNAFHDGVLTIGNFDGFHQGHQALIKQLVTMARNEVKPAIVMLFEPQPQEFFGIASLPRLTNLREKLIHLKEAAVDGVVIMSFNQKFAGLTAERFIKEILSEHLKISHLFVGSDFRFGQEREGDINLLSQMGDQANFILTISDDITYNHQRISSTAIRQLLSDSCFQEAEEMLGRPFMLRGRVSHGNKIAREIGIPTANIRLKRRTPPIQGVFAVSVHGLDSEPLPAIANIGYRPTVGGTGLLLEVHVFDYHTDLYGKDLTVEILGKMRDEQCFESFEDLTQQIQQDLVKAKAFHASNRITQ